jgi:hypothetical protein
MTVSGRTVTAARESETILCTVSEAINSSGPLNRCPGTRFVSIAAHARGGGIGLEKQKQRTDSKDKSTLIGAMGRVFVGHFELSVLKLNDPARAFHVLEAARGRGLLEVIRSSRKGNVPLGSTINSTQLVALQTRLTSEPNPATRRALLDKLWETEVRSFNYREQQPADLPTPEPVRLRDLQSILKPDEIVLEYVLGQDRSFALEIGRRHVKSYTLASRRLIEGAVEHYVETAKGLGDVGQQARDLYRMLLAPISGVDAARRIVIVPDGALHGLPFDALIDPSGALLVSRAVISYAPSASVNFLLSRGVHGQHCSRGKELLAIGGISYGGDQATDKLRMARLLKESMQFEVIRVFILGAVSIAATNR